MVDVTVRGAGVMGLSVAFACARRGMGVQVIDPFGIAAGASGGVVGALSPHLPETWTETKAFQRDALADAPRWWAEVARIGGEDPGYARTGRLIALADAAAVERARDRAAGAAEHWPQGCGWQVVRAADMHPPLVPATEWVVREGFSARLHPARATRALAAAVRALGGRIVAEGHEAGIHIEATGYAGLDSLSAWRGRLVGAGIKGQGATLDYSAPDAPQIQVDGLHVVPHADGTTGIGSTTERTWDAPGCDDLLEDVLDRIRAHVPALARAPVLRRWSGIRPRARTRAPMLGPHPMRDGWIANGGFKIGFAMAPLMAERLAAILSGKDAAIPGAFAPEASL
ncbi:MAG: NAD(P)/FAD-dependent oxidoreductase [Paracoccaceae bacterium]